MITYLHLNHKSKKNNHDRNQYYQEDHHEAIISREDFLAVQKKLKNNRGGNPTMLPKLQVMDSGILSGFVAIHPKWAGFTADDYRQASQSIASKETIQQSSIQIKAQPGDFDLRGYEVARGQYFQSNSRISVTFSRRTIIFSNEAIRKLGVHGV